MSLLEKYGKQLIEDHPEILTYRKIGHINNYSQFSFELLKNIINDINIINIEEYTYYIKHKQHLVGHEMNWHLDDGIILNIKENNKNDICLTDSKKNNLPVSKPKYTLIIYESDYDVNFKGGTFRFVNHIIEPNRGYYIFFDSREPYKLEKIISGSRHSIIIKFYS
tara:strand:- start:1273 stop:1770 length:498 start_codon:yes stop_codon:yes gene_type:complete